MNETMTTPGGTTPGDEQLFARLRAMWTARDPMPEGLIDDILVRLATEDLNSEYALLTLVSESTELVGARGLSDNHTLEFSDGSTTVLLRVSAAGPGRRRVDGWLAPASVASLRIETATGELATIAGDDGRFAFVEVPEGSARLWLDPTQGSAQPQGFTTPEFDL